jgi:hypothetical protein
VALTAGTISPDVTPAIVLAFVGQPVAPGSTIDTDGRKS